jgi:hypothetical protein
MRLYVDTHTDPKPKRLLITGGRFVFRCWAPVGIEQGGGRGTLVPRGG